MKKWTVLMGIGAITVLEAVALVHGIDGTALAAATGAIGTIIGYVVKGTR